MKKDDGAWRFIYVNAAGQIIGSVKYATLQQMAIMDMNGGKIPGVKHEATRATSPAFRHRASRIRATQSESSSRKQRKIHREGGAASAQANSVRYATASSAPG